MKTQSIKSDKNPKFEKAARWKGWVTPWEGRKVLPEREIKKFLRWFPLHHNPNQDFTSKFLLACSRYGIVAVNVSGELPAYFIASPGRNDWQHLCEDFEINPENVGVKVEHPADGEGEWNSSQGLSTDVDSVIHHKTILRAKKQTGQRVFCPVDEILCPLDRNPRPIRLCIVPKTARVIWMNHGMCRPRGIIYDVSHKGELTPVIPPHHPQPEDGCWHPHTRIRSWGESAEEHLVALSSYDGPVTAA